MILPDRASVGDVLTWHGAAHYGCQIRVEEQTPSGDTFGVFISCPDSPEKVGSRILMNGETALWEKEDPFVVYVRRTLEANAHD